MAKGKGLHMFVLALLGAVVLLLSGCGGGPGGIGAIQTGTISGSVWYEGLDGSVTPLPQGQVIASGPKLVEAQVTEGVYTITGLSTGSYRVTLAQYTVQEDGLATLIPAEWPSVAVYEGVETVNVDFVVQVMPPLPSF